MNWTDAAFRQTNLWWVRKLLPLFAFNQIYQCISLNLRHKHWQIWLDHEKKKIAPRTTQIKAFMNGNLHFWVWSLRVHNIWDIFNYTTVSGMSNSIVKITRTSTKTAKHTQGVWEILVWLVYLELCAALVSWLQKGLGMSRRTCLTASWDWP